MPSQVGAGRYVTVKGRQNAYLTALATGSSRKDALREAGLVAMGTVYNWRKQYPEFRERERELTISRITHSQPNRIRPVSNDPADLMSTDVFCNWRQAIFGFETYYHQRRIVDVLHQAMKRKDSGVVLVLVPPEHGKTTLLNDWVCRRLSVESNLRILVVQESAERAKRFIGRVKGRMTGNRPYIADHGRPFYVAGQEKQGKVWSAKALKMFDFDADEADYSLEAVGWTSQIAGQRVDVMIVDDIQSMRSLNQTATMFETFRQDFLSSRITRDGMVAVIGTRVGPGDFYEKLLNEGLVDYMVDLPAHAGIVTECDQGAECSHPELVHYEPLCPEMFTPHRLVNKQRQAGTSAWSRNWMQRPQDDVTAPFPGAVVDAAYDDDLDIGQVRDGGATVLGVDPAIVGNCVLAVGGYYHDRFDLIDMVIRSDLGSTEGIFAMIETSVIRYKPQTVVIETNSWQRLFREDRRLREMARVHGFRIEPNDTLNLKNDEVLGVAMMASSMGRGELKLAGTPEARRRLETFDAEVRAWRAYTRNAVITQDTVMATWFIWRYWYEQRQRDVAAHSDFSTGHRLPWTPTAGTAAPMSSEAAQFERHMRQMRELERANVKA